MKDHVKVLYRGGEGVITEKKSRFIATTCPVRTEDEAQAFVAEMRKKYFDARHNCYAFVIGDEGNISRQSDDGEPSRTAGLPILNVLSGNEITDACIVVTRYFGGTLLGTGGLFRAYTKAAEEGLKASIILEKMPAERWRVVTDYSDIGKIQNLAEKDGLFILDSIYTDKVEFTLLIPLPKAEEEIGRISEMTGSGAGTERIGSLPYALLDGRIITFDEESLAIPKDG